MDQIPPPGPPINFHIRIGTIITLLATIDLLLVLYSLDSILTYGVSAKVLFVSEFMVLLASIHGTMARYVVNCLDLRRARGREDAPAWEQKSMYMFYIDLGVGQFSVHAVCQENF
jgi:E3 ubiquitin-protein ligase synoviolin